MFLRHWSGLPEDPKFPCDLEKLGYFINDIDEIRSIQNPDNYFKYFLDHNERVNYCQGFAFNTAAQDIVHARLEKEGLEKIPLPLGVSCNEPHVPIFASRDVKTKSRVIVIFGDTCQMLGVLAMRVVNGRGGVDKGSLVSIVREIKNQRCSPGDESTPGIVIANPAELWWWPEGKRSLDVPRRGRVPMATAVHLQRLHNDRVNTISENKDPETHTKYIFKNVLPRIIGEHAKIDIIGVGHSCQALESFLDQDENWENHAANRLNALVFLGMYWRVGIHHGQRLKKFLEERSRVYITDSLPVNTPIANSEGNPKYPAFTSFGCPVYSAGSCDSYVEMILVNAHNAILGWLQRVSDTPGYRNDPNMAVVNPVVADAKDDDEEARKRAWEEIPDETRPPVEMVDSAEMLKERKLARAWLRYEKTGEFAPSDDEDED